MKIIDLETPALIIDLDRVEANLRRWQAFCDRHHFKNRPHIKTHKIPELAKLQIEAGAVGVTCQKLGEAEVMADGGIDDLFLTYNIVGPEKLARLAALHRRAAIRTIADSREVADGLNGMAQECGKPLLVFVECDTGMHRIGVGTPGEAAALAVYIASCEGLRFGGFSTYPTNDKAVDFMREARRLCEAQGVPVPDVSGGGTPGMWRLASYDGFTEYRAGTFIYGDRITVANGAASPDDVAITLLVSVVSTAGEAWCTVDGGTKVFSSDQYGQEGYGVVLDHPDHLLTRASEEHGVLQVEGCKPAFPLGTKLRIIPNHACIVSNLHDLAYAVRGDEVVGQWSIAARGKVR